MILIADLHLGKESDSFIYSPGNIPSQRNDILSRLIYIADRARKTGQAVAILGDIFNRVHPTTAVISTLFEFFQAFPDVKFYLFAGNHDAGVNWSNSTMLHHASLPHVKVFNQITVYQFRDVTGEQSVLIVPHIPLAERERILQERGMTISEYAGGIAHSGVVFTHAMYSGSSYENDIFFEAGDAMEIFLPLFKKSLIFSGHIHQHQVIENKKNKTSMIYPGSITITNFGEVDDEKGFIEFNLSDKSWEFIPFPEDTATPWVHVELDMTSKDETQIDEKMVAEIASSAIIKITAFVNNYGTLNEAYIRQLFNKYGFVSRFETRILGNNEESRKAIHEGVSHEKLLDQWLSESEAKAKIKARAKKVASEIFQEVIA
jgi:DNA repair exonuclease SbcCD nuclease subunit